MLLSSATPRLANIRLHPIKSLDPVFVSEARISSSGGLALDRAWALHSVDGKWVNGKRTPLIHHIRANYTPDLRCVTLSVPTDRRKIPPRTFAFPEAHAEAAEWFSVFFEQQIVVRYSQGGFPDDSIANGPTIVSTASLQAVANWFTADEGASPKPAGSTPDIEEPNPTKLPPQAKHSRHSERSPRSEESLLVRPSPMPLHEVRERFRATLEIDGVPAFWEDQLFGQDERSVLRFTIGEVHFEGSNPCARCPVPPRDPRTGDILEGFQRRFTQQREATLPEWSPRDRFDHFYRLSTNTRVASTESGKLLRLGDVLSFS